MTSRQGPLAILAVGCVLVLAAAFGVIAFAYLQQADTVERLECRVDQQADVIDDLTATARNTSEGVQVIRDLAEAFAGLSSSDPAVREEARERLAEIRAEAQAPPAPAPAAPENDGTAAPAPTTTTTQPSTTSTSPPSSQATTTTRSTLLPPPFPPLTLPDIDLVQTVPEPCK